MSPRRAAALAGLVGAIVGAASSLLEAAPVWTAALALALGAAVGLLPLRPRVAWVAAAVILLGLALAEEGSLYGVGLLAAVHAFGAGRWESSRGALAGIVAIVATGQVGVALSHDSPVPWLMIPGAAWAAGRALGQKEEVASRLAERARELEEEREAYAALSVRYERARIASELHDIVAHAISVIVIQAGAGQRLAAHDPQGTAETLEAIASAAREAEEDVGRLVALLGDETAIGAAPDLALVEELVARAAGSGLDVALRLEGEREGLPADVAQASYRIVQEGLTNALRYASGAAVTVSVRGTRSELVVDVENGPGTREGGFAGGGTGNGLRGVRERVDGCGGTMEAGPTPDGGWRVHARLPRRVPTSA